MADSTTNAATSTAATQPSNAGPAADPVDTLNPTSIASAPGLPTFSSVEPLWYNNGKWGAAGYAIPNLAGKTFTVNDVIWKFFNVIGQTFFSLMHREDVQFERAPYKQWLFDLHQSIIVARKRLADQAKAPNDSNGLVVQKAAPAPKMFLLWPIPYFGGRIRQPDILSYAEIALMMLSEIAQSVENDQVGWISTNFQGVIGRYLQEIYAQMGMKFFGYSRTQAYDPSFTLQAADFTKYDPSSTALPVEINEDRAPRQWWPSTIDLVPIQALPVAQAEMFAARWPTNSWLDSGDPTVWPGLAAQQASGTSGAAPSNSTSTAPTGATGTSFVTPTGTAP